MRNVRVHVRNVVSDELHMYNGLSFIPGLVG